MQCKEEILEAEKMERKGRAQVKKDRFKEKQMMMAKDRKITEMMTELPIEEQERIMKE